jgi:hypothetical protein
MRKSERLNQEKEKENGISIPIRNGNQANAKCLA